MPDPILFISAGEASGEALRRAADRRPAEAASARRGAAAHFVGMGGPRMAAAGLDRVVRAEDMAVMGITEVVRHLPRIYREFRKLKQSIRERRPDVAVLIDFPDIHFKLAEELHRLGVPVIFFVSPQLWAWKKHRIKLVQKYVDRMLVIFPFEEPFYREHGVDGGVRRPSARRSAPARRSPASSSPPTTASIRPRPGSACSPAAAPRRFATTLPEMLEAAARLAGRARAAARRLNSSFLCAANPEHRRSAHLVQRSLRRVAHGTRAQPSAAG